MAASAPERGDLIWMNFTPQAGREQAGHRPAVVLSRSVYNARTGLAIVAPITSQRKGYPFEVPLPDGLPVQGCVLTDHVRSIDWRARRAQPTGHRLPDELEALVRTMSRRLLE